MTFLITRLAAPWNLKIVSAKMLASLSIIICVMILSIYLTSLNRQVTFYVLLAVLDLSVVIHFAPDILDGISRSEKRSEKLVFSGIEDREKQIVSRMRADGDHGEPDISLQLYNHVSDIVDALSFIISSEVNANCSVSVKLLCRASAELGNQSAVVRTFMRDSASRVGRESYGPPNNYGWRENTAFLTAVSIPESGGYFASDNLLALSAAGKYGNLNERWRALYNSTAVLTVHGEWDKTDRAIVGFLCVDSRYGRLTGERIKRLLVLTAKHLYTAVQLICLTESPAASTMQAPSEGSVHDFHIGWTYTDNDLVLADWEHQALLERSLSNLQQRFASRASQSPRGEPGISGLPLMQRDMMPRSPASDDDEEIPEALLPPHLRKARERLKSITDNEFVDVLKDTSKGNPYGEKLLQAILKKKPGLQR